MVAQDGRYRFPRVLGVNRELRDLAGRGRQHLVRVGGAELREQGGKRKGSGHVDGRAEGIRTKGAAGTVGGRRSWMQHPGRAESPALPSVTLREPGPTRGEGVIVSQPRPDGQLKKRACRPYPSSSRVWLSGQYTTQEVLTLTLSHEAHVFYGSSSNSTNPRSTRSPSIPPLNPDATFGVPFAEGQADSTPIRIWMLHSPEGLTLVGACSSCGGRAERLIDVSGISDPIEAQAEGLLGTALAGESLRIWGLSHSDCVRLPQRHHRPHGLTGTLERAEGFGRELLAAGEPVPPHSAVLLENGEIILVRLDAIPGPENLKARRAAVATLHQEARHQIRAARSKPVAVVTMTEVWSSAQGDTQPTFAADRVEHLMIALMTPTWGEMALGRIVRASGRAEQGPGSIGRLVWRPLRGPCPMLDGLLAERVAIP